MCMQQVYIPATSPLCAFGAMFIRVYYTSEIRRKR